MRGAFLLLLLPTPALAQSVLDGRVLDAATHEPLPYCSVVVHGTTHGTITNVDGFFRLDADSLRDTLRFSFVGYAPVLVPASSVSRTHEVKLQPEVTVLPAVNVRPNDELYERVIRVAKAMRRAAPYRSKLYFELETHLEERPTEVVECFYNARFDGARITGLDLKHGRIGIAPVDDRFFVSLNTTKAISLLDPTADNAHFPDSPLQWNNVRALKKHYLVEPVSVALDGLTPDHLRLIPRDGSGFSADLWLDHSTDQVLVLEFRCTQCASYPFLPLWSGDTITRVDMRFRETWHTVKDRRLLDHIELDYALVYANGNGSEHVGTKAVLHVLEPDGAFMLPLFEYDREQNDYRKITFQPYDSAFWATAPTLVRTAQQERDIDFLARNGVLTGSTSHQALHGKPFFESNYAWWSPVERISIKSYPPKQGTPDIQSKGITAPITQVDLRAQLYLDMDTLNGALRTRSATVFDGFTSYYHLPEEPYTPCFINLFFDLCEIERRKMDDRLHQPGVDLESARRIHAEAVAEMEHTTQRYIKEVRLGADRAALVRWNGVVKDALGIDNFALFGL